MKRLWKIALVAGFVIVPAVLARHRLPVSWLVPLDRARLPAPTLPAESPIPADRVVVIHKAERVLGLYLDRKLAKTYPIGLGQHPEGSKERSGDSRTPEGRYFVCTRNPRSRFHLFLGVSYPGVGDAERGLRAGLVSAEQHHSIVEAVNAGRQPPWDTLLGGEVGLHGGGSERDWTAGCIAMDNAAVGHLWESLKIGDPVLIKP